LTLAASVCLASEGPSAPAHEARYTVTRGGKQIGYLHASLWQREDALWNYRLESEATSWLVRSLGIQTTESSWFDWRAGRPLPLTYHHVSREPGKDRYWQHRFDWQAGQTDTRTHDGPLHIALRPGVLDPLTLRLAASSRIAAAAPEFKDLEFDVVERDEVEPQKYRFKRAELAEIDGRCFDTVVYERFRKAGSSRNYLAWHARELGWLPVRIEHHESDKNVVIALDRWQPASGSRPPSSSCPKAPARVE